MSRDVSILLDEIHELEATIATQREVIERLKRAICISVREEFNECFAENDEQAVEWFERVFDECNYAATTTGGE